jgi:hypothetical protein
MTAVFVSLASLWLAAGLSSVTVCWLESRRPLTAIDAACSRLDEAFDQLQQSQTPPRAAYASRRRLELG